MTTMTPFRAHVILIPHQNPPSIVDPAVCPPDPEAGDRLCAMDHDMHAALTVGEWLDNPTIRPSHQRHAVAALVAAFRFESLYHS